MGLVNAVPSAPGRTLGQILRANVFTRFNAILGSLLVVVAIVGPVQDGLFGIVLVANTTIGVVQELRAKRTLDRLAIVNAPRARVVRGGEIAELPVSEVVRDDVLEVRSGDQVVVDGVVLRADHMEVDESLVSGEARPVGKGAGHKVLSGSFVVSGAGRMQATAVGAASYAAALEERARRFSVIRSELQLGTNALLRMVTWVMVPAGVGLVLTQLLRSHQSGADALRSSVAGVSAMVPEGLVLLTSIAFAVGALRLARDRVLVQELPAVEGLARVDVLCIDKTGTLTAPGMRLAEVSLMTNISRDRVQDVLEAMVAADPAPNATLRALHQEGRLPPPWRIEDRVPFSSARKWSATSFQHQGTWVLGAPEVLLRSADADVPSAVTVAGRSGRRALLLARCLRSIDATTLPRPLLSVAVLVLAEELRQDATTTIEYLLAQGITVKVLSGDAPGTVAEVAARVGIPGSGRAVDASLLVDDTGLVRALQETDVLGRVSPDQKLAAVRALEEQGHVVAMIGDGVNDVQALKQADLGIAMGSGSQSSRSVARVVLLDSAFSSVPKILGEGRRVVANIERVAKLFVTKTVYAALLAIVVAVTAVPFPFFPRHLTIVSTFTIGIPGFFLALASGAPRALPGFTRTVLRFAAPAGIAGGVATFAAYAIARGWPGIDATEARTTATLALFVFGLWILVVVALPLNGPKLVLIVAVAAGGVIPISFSYGRRIFALALPGTDVLLAVVATVTAAIVALTIWRRVSATRADAMTPSSPHRHRRGVQRDG